VLEAYLNWPKQIKGALESWGKYRVEGLFNEVLVVGMGGSGIVGDYLQVLSLTRGSIPVYTVKSHILPRFVDENTLILAVSYSGNTHETLSALRKAIASRAKVVTVSSGGILENEALKHKLLHIPVPSGLQPRASLPAMLYSILGLLDSSGYSLVTGKEAYESLKFLEANTEHAELVAGEIAKWVYEKVIGEERLFVIATHTPLDSLALRGKNEFNENSKLIVNVDIAPEWMHNSIVGYEHPVTRRFFTLEIVDPEDEAGFKLVEFMEKIYSQHDAVAYKLTLRGGNILEKLMYGSLVLGLTSVMLAELRGLNPAETKNITLYKQEASKIFHK
jgi:glucose/mannose-6-phosphate isomerase